MARLENILTFNEQFVQSQDYLQYQTTRFPDKKLVILSCMDTRLTELLPKAMNLRNGDAKIIKNAGAVITHPFGSVMRSILVAIYELNAEEVCIVGHHDCGMNSIQPASIMEKMRARDVSAQTIDTIEHSGIDIHTWLHGFSNVQDSVRSSVDTVKNHPLIPKDVAVHGLVIDPSTGKLDLVVDGYEALKSEA